ncbi:hypothetical protein GGI04_001961 [Coemansia thaxteri]|nr:hypothetical protein GGI04_001961 [Coemansia thaxteri]KAJ2472075.1 hypothetical protein GGI02_001844 [Coemansia sp. RSA 2322]KAJ2479594.1 hypothetical protein EV174_003973 [Coemansia sp. RSA 2320]
MHEGDDLKSRFIEPAHKGPCMVYLAPLESDGVGKVWFKIFEDGYDLTTKKFCTEKMMDTKGKLDIVIPEDIPQGNYLMRTEVIALHTADERYAGNDDGPGAELFPNCAQIFLISKGTANPEKYEIPGIYGFDDPGILINIYDPIKSYKIPGPPLYSKDLATVMPPKRRPCVKRTKRAIR